MRASTASEGKKFQKEMVAGVCIKPFPLVGVRFGPAGPVMAPAHLYFGPNPHASANSVLKSGVSAMIQNNCGALLANQALTVHMSVKFAEPSLLT